MKNKMIVVFVVLFCLATGLTYSISEAKSNSFKEKSQKIFGQGRLDSYSKLGTEFVYYKIPTGLTREELIATAQKIHEGEPNAHLVLVDDDSQVEDYIEFAKLINPGYNDVKMPKKWADQHIVANVQRYLNGKFGVCEGYGSKEIAELK
jgi:hypothetical protein